MKIQYPAIGRSIRSDFRNLSAFLLPLRLGRGWEPMKAQLEEVRRVIEQETDYQREAEWQRRARSLFHEDDPILVPRVHDELSTRRVLTMEYLDGVHIHAFLAGNPPQELRDHFGGLIVQAGCRLHYAGRLLYADPHPGNFLFRADGRLGLLDFGCVRPYTDREWECNRLADLAIRGGDDDVVRALRASLGLAEGEEIDPEILARNVEFGRWIWRPYWHDGPFDFGDPGYLREGVDRFAAIGRARITAPWLPMNAFIARWYFGMAAMLYRLRARVERAGDLPPRAPRGRVGTGVASPPGRAASNNSRRWRSRASGNGAATSRALRHAPFSHEPGGGTACDTGRRTGESGNLQLRMSCSAPRASGNGIVIISLIRL